MIDRLYIGFCNASSDHKDRVIIKDFAEGFCPNRMNKQHLFLIVLSVSNWRVVAFISRQRSF